MKETKEKDIFPIEYPLTTSLKIYATRILIIFVIIGINLAAFYLITNNTASNSPISILILSETSNTGRILFHYFFIGLMTIILTVGMIRTQSTPQHPHSNRSKLIPIVIILVIVVTLSLVPVSPPITSETLPSPTQTDNNVGGSGGGGY